MAISTRWKIAGATAAASGLLVGGLVGLSSADDRPSTDPITLRDEQPATVVEDPAPVDPSTTGFDIDSPESVDSPFESVVDSPDSVNSPASVASPASVQSPNSPASVASPASVQSPASVDSPASVESADSP